MVTVCPSQFATRRTLFHVLVRSEERFSRNAETELVCRLLLEKKKRQRSQTPGRRLSYASASFALRSHNARSRERHTVSPGYSFRTNASRSAAAARASAAGGCHSPGTAATRRSTPWAKVVPGCA